MSPKGQITIIIFGILAGAFVTDLLKRRKLNEEYCLWWLFIITATMILVVRQDLLLFITHAIGALVPVSTLTLFGLLLILGMLIYFSTKISILSNQVKDLSQYIAILKNELTEKSIKKEKSGIKDQ